MSHPPHPFRHATCELRRKIAAEKPSPRRGEEKLVASQRVSILSPWGRGRRASNRSPGERDRAWLLVLLWAA